MPRMLSSLAFSSVLALGLCLFAALDAAAQTREFTGRIDRVDEEKLIVDNRMGDKVSFARADASVVVGEKSSWEDLKQSDWVTVHWKMIDKPRKAYKVLVLPPRKSEGEDS